MHTWATKPLLQKTRGQRRDLLVGGRLLFLKNFVVEIFLNWVNSCSRTNWDAGLSLAYAYWPPTQTYFWHQMPTTDHIFGLQLCCSNCRNTRDVKCSIRCYNVWSLDVTKVKYFIVSYTSCRYAITSPTPTRTLHAIKLTWRDYLGLWCEYNYRKCYNII